MTCIDPSAAADLVHVLGADPEDRLRHMSGCERCLEALADTAVLAGVLATDASPRRGFAESVAETLQGEGAPSRSTPGRGWGGWAAGWLMAALTAVVAAAAASAAAPIAHGPRTLAMAAVWASAAFALTARTTLREPEPQASRR
ncbi:MAG: hypothetical protein HKO53_02600 [Gemmatimonadetes bacterium]|nr:hypothetical protein [Gemmatimonadota bacterium]NNM31922.1 hypothetical protein [Gemmatimonadota bacterium]